MLVEPEGRVLSHFPTARSSRTRLLRVAIGRPATSSARPFGCWNTAKPTCGRCERHWWTANGPVDASTPSLPANALRSRAAGEPYICCHPPPEPTSNTSGDHTRDRCDVNQAEEYLRDSSGPSKGSQRIPGSVGPATRSRPATSNSPSGLTCCSTGSPPPRPQKFLTTSKQAQSGPRLLVTCCAPPVPGSFRTTRQIQCCRLHRRPGAKHPDHRSRHRPWRYPVTSLT